jgi:DNA replication initiation complex subunit (GINS family)
MDDPMDLMVLNKIQWKERVQTSQKVTSVPVDFYPKLRRYLEELNEEAIKKPEKRNDYEKAMNLSDDIARMRLKKIVSLASSSSKTQTSQILRSLTNEEKSIYSHLHTIISQWRNEILKSQRVVKT